MTPWVSYEETMVIQSANLRLGNEIELVWFVDREGKPKCAFHGKLLVSDVKNTEKRLEMRLGRP